MSRDPVPTHALRRIAVLNRGEAAIRFLRAVREANLERGSAMEAVAFYTDPDEGAPFVRLADDAVHLGPPQRPGPTGPVSAYCDAAHVLAHVRAARCDAVWPGWGFASEDAAFVERLEQAGITFIGPSAAAMRLLGDKIAAKRLAEAAGLPVAPWAVVEDGAGAAGEALVAAGRIGYPLMVKASAGGGGRGIRRVESPAELPAALTQVGEEVRKVFGQGGVFLEACVTGARHVEVQLVCGADGRAVAVGLRDCTIQRRHQKVVEEAPAPGLPPELERALCEGAERLAASAGYVGVATVELLVDPRTARACFLEVNTRLQVEHTVTELVTGCDLVRAQLDIAQGLAWEPGEPAGRRAPRGHAVEVRLCAEDPERGFAPSPGLVRLLRLPSGPGVRVDAGVAEGTAVAPDFDSMLAKVMAWGPTRPAAIARLRRALGELEVVLEDGATNKGFLLQLLARPAFLDGTADTAWLGRTPPEAPDFATEALLFAAVVEYRVRRHADIQRFFAEAQLGIPRHLPAPDGVTSELRLRGATHRIEVHALTRDHYLAGPAGALRPVTVAPAGPHAAVLQVGDGGRRHRVLYSQGRTGISVEIDGSMHTLERVGGGLVRATAPALVVHVAVAEGQRVAAGDRLCTLEAMKMETPVFAPEGGVVRAVLCQANQHVTAGQPLVALDVAEHRDEAACLGAPEPRPVDRLLGSRPAPALLDALPPEEGAAAMAELLALLRALFLGFDVPAPLASRMEALLADDRAFAALAHPDRWAPLGSLLDVFASTESLFGLALPGADGEASAELSFYELCRRHHEGEAAAPAALLPLLRRALPCYGVRAVEPGEPLREALWRMAVAHAHGALRHRLCSSLLRMVVALHEVGVPIDGGLDLRDALARVAQVAGAAWPFVADSARQASYVLFEQPRYVERRQTLERLVDDALAAWRAGADTEAALGASWRSPSRSPLAASGRHDRGAIEPSTADGLLERVVQSRQSLLPLLVRRADPAAPEAPTLARAILRRMFAGEPCIVQTAGREGPLVVLRADLGGRPLLALLARAADLDAALAVARSEALRTPGVLVELILQGTPEDPALEAALAAPLGASRLVVTWCAAHNGRDAVHHRTAEPEGDRRVEVSLLRDIHPEAARRIELDRLSEFDLERLDAPEQIYCFRARARTNPEDERLFVFIEARDVPALPAPPEEEGALWELEQAWYEAMRVLRDHQSRRDPRRRLHWNRVTVHVRPVVPLDVRGVTWVARRLEAPTRGLGLEKVVVAARVPGQDGAARAAVFTITKPGRHRLEVREQAPSRAPVRAISAYELRVVRARRLGCVYPYEVVAMLEGRLGREGARGAMVPHPDMARGRFVEHDLDTAGRLVPVHRPPGRNTAGVVVGVIVHETAKHPEGMARVLVASDPTASMGALAEPECRRIVAAIDLAARLGLPLEWVPISAGALIAMDSGTENLDWTARVLRRIVEHTEAGGVIHVIVAGVNVGAQSYWNAEATMLMHTKGLTIMTPEGSMVLTGKRALEISGSVAAEDERGIGGFERIMGPNGEAQHLARDLGEAYAILLEHYRFTWRAPGEGAPRLHPTRDPRDRSILDSPYRSPGEPFTRVGELFDERTNPGRKRPFAIREVMAATIDADGGYLERWRAMSDAETAVVWDAHVGGHPVCLVGLESRPLPRRGRIPLDGPDTWSGGTLFPRSSKKVARALRAASGVRPVVVLANLSGFDGSPESLRELQLEHGAEIGRAVTLFEGPIVFVVIGRYHGGAYVVFSKALNPSLVALAVEGSYASVIGGAPAAAVVFPREVRRRTEADPRVGEARAALAAAPPARRPRLRERLDTLHAQVLLEKQGEVAREFDGIHTVQRAVAVGSLDAVIPPSRIRPAIVEALDAARAGRAEVAELAAEPARGAAWPEAATGAPPG